MENEKNETMSWDDMLELITNSAKNKIQKKDEFKKEIENLKYKHFTDFTNDVITYLYEYRVNDIVLNRRKYFYFLRQNNLYYKSEEDINNAKYVIILGYKIKLEGTVR
jgi:hypothetical protein